MDTRNYWSGRIRRRTALRGAGLGIAGLAGAALVGCGSKTEVAPAVATETAPVDLAKSRAQAEEKSILTKRVDTTAQGKPGGILPSSRTADVDSMDPLAATSFTANAISRYVYPQLMEFKVGLIDEASGEVQGQLVERAEFVEPTKLVLTLRKDVKWDSRAPTNGRALTSEDVVFSWKKFAAKSVSRASLANSASKSAPILDIVAQDPNTVVVTTAFPYGPLTLALAYTRWLQIMPKESDGGFDPRKDMRGAGPWMLTKHEPSVRFEFRRNPTYWKPGRPFMDGIDAPIVAEYAQRLAQFRAGKIYGGVVNQEDIIKVKSELPQLEVYQGEFGRATYKVYFGLRPNSPFRDQRVRQATSMLVDRDLMIETFNDTKAFKNAGWPVDTRWNSMGVAAGYDAYWLDPKGKLGDGGKFFQYNVGEAKKLMDAAGIKGPIETTFTYISTSQYGTAFPRVGEAYKGMFDASGLFKLKTVNADYQTDYLPKYYFAKGDFDGLAWGATTTFPHPVQHLLDYYHSKGSRQKVAFQGDPKSIEGQQASDDLIDKAARSLDFRETVELIQRWQKEQAIRMPLISSPWPSGAPAYTIQWPWVKNIGAYRDYLEQAEQNAVPNWWLDQTLMKG